MEGKGTTPLSIGLTGFHALMLYKDRYVLTLYETFEQLYPMGVTGRCLYFVVVLLFLVLLILARPFLFQRKAWPFSEREMLWAVLQTVTALVPKASNKNFGD